MASSKGAVAALILWTARWFALGQTNYSPWFVRSWTSDENLPNNTVTAIAQTTDGFLWLGTSSSLVRFDGLRFEEFSPANFIAPPNRGIIAMAREAQGALWLAMDRGGVVYLKGQATKAFVAGLPSSIPYSLVPDNEPQTVWISYRGGAVYRLKEGEAKRCGVETGIPEGTDNCALGRDAQGRVWFAKAGHCGILRDGTFQSLFSVPAQASRLAAARGGGVWLCAGDQLLKCDEQHNVKDFGKFNPSRADTTVAALLEDHEGAVWIGTSFSGLFRYDETGFEFIQPAHEEILCLAEDREANLWVGTAGGGLHRLRRRALALEGLESGLPFAAVQSICEDPEENLWAATQSGVMARRTGRRWTALPPSEGWPTDATCVTADAQGTLWVGTRHSGVLCWRGGKFVACDGLEQLRGRTSHTLLMSRSGDLWIGVENPSALLRWRDGRLDTFTVPQDSRIIRAMTEDSAGNIWAGTSEGILLRVTGDKVSPVTLRHDRENASIRCLSATPDGALWIGYAGWGIGCLKNGSYAEIRAAQGLYDDYISHIVPDARGWIWFGANHGVFKVRLDELEAVASGQASYVRSIHYGRSQGLPSLQGTYGDSPDALRSRDGRIWLPMRTALVEVDPSMLEENTESSPALLMRVTVDDRPVAWYGGLLPMPKDAPAPMLDLAAPDSTLRIGPGYRRLAFEFTAPSFVAPENVQFRYRLQGLDQEWTEAGTRRIMSYLPLPARNYEFHAAARGSDGPWTECRNSLRMQVVPFVWQTSWFRGLLLGAFTLAIAGVVRYVSFRRLQRRLRVLEAQAALHKERARIAKDIHDDLGANLTQIALLSELARQDQAQPERAAARIETISGTARNSIKALDEIVWAVNPRNDTLAHLIDYAGQFALDHLRLAGIRCRLDLPEQAPARELSSEVRHNLFLAMKEALNNIAKHAAATEVWLRIRSSDQGLEIQIEDNGRGFTQAPDNALADGLRNMRQRLDEVGGQCKIQSQPGAGTRVTFLLPWPAVAGPRE